jgi:lauroyl/myristoyl acyltransferase
VMEAPIEAPRTPDKERIALERLMAVVAKRVAETPQQWLMLHAVWLEDQK